VAPIVRPELAERLVVMELVFTPPLKLARFVTVRSFAYKLVVVALVVVAFVAVKF
jgi:hypothetical protein